MERDIAAHDGIPAPSSSTATSRVFVSQMHRSPGVLFDQDPRQGPIRRASTCCSLPASFPIAVRWLDFEFDAKDIVTSRTTASRKLPGTALALCSGPRCRRHSAYFYNTVVWDRAKDGLEDPVPWPNMAAVRSHLPVDDAATGRKCPAARDQPARWRTRRPRMALPICCCRSRNRQPLCRRGEHDR